MRLTSRPDYEVGKIETIVEREPVIRLLDLVFRRTTITVAGLLDRDGIPELRRIAANVLRWIDAERAPQTQAMETVAARTHSIDLESSVGFGRSRPQFKRPRRMNHGDGTSRRDPAIPPP